MYLIGCILVTKPQAVITVATSISDISLITPYVTKPQAVITVATSAKIHSVLTAGKLVTKPQAVITVATECWVVKSQYYIWLQNRKR